MDWANAFKAIWGEEQLQRRQECAASDEKVRAKARKAASQMQREVDYRKWRETRVEMANSDETSYTPRGKSVSIPLSGFTARGPAPQAAKGTSAVKMVSVGAHHAAVGDPVLRASHRARHTLHLPPPPSPRHRFKAIF